AGEDRRRDRERRSEPEAPGSAALRRRRGQSQARDRRGGECDLRRDGRAAAARAVPQGASAGGAEVGGGVARHPPIPRAHVHAFAEWLSRTAPSVAIQSTFWFIRLLQATHLITAGVACVSGVMIALRVLGAQRADQPFAAVWARFAPWLAASLGLML